MPLRNPLVFPTENALLFFTAIILKMQIAGFVILPNYFYLIFAPGKDHQLSHIQRDMLKYTGQQIKFDRFVVGDNTEHGWENL